MLHMSILELVCHIYHIYIHMVIISNKNNMYVYHIIYIVHIYIVNLMLIVHILK